MIQTKPKTPGLFDYRPELTASELFWAGTRDRNSPAIPFKRGTGKANIIEYFLMVTRRKWINHVRLAQVFQDRAGDYFVGLQYRRRMQELTADGYLESEPDPDAPNRTHRWRLAPAFLRELEDLYWKNRG